MFFNSSPSRNTPFSLPPFRAFTPSLASLSPIVLVVRRKRPAENGLDLDLLILALIALCDVCVLPSFTLSFTLCSFVDAIKVQLLCFLFIHFALESVT
jgi:hypothetical protein